MAPTEEQAAGLRRNVGAVRFAQNASQRSVKNSLDAGEKRSWTPVSLHTRWREERAEVAPWYGECSKEAFQDGCTRAATALKNWSDSKNGKRAGKAVDFAKFRKRGKNDSWTFTAGAVRPDGLAVRVPRVGWVALKEALVVPDGTRVTALTVRAVAGGSRWTVTARVREEAWEPPVKKTGGLGVGVDLGVGERFAVLHTSDGQTREVENPRFFRSDEKRLRRASRRHSRRQKGSANRRKAQARLGRVHWAVANRRADFLHKFTTDLVKTHDLIVLEDLSVAGMARRRKKGYRLGKSVADVALREVRRQVEYKAEWHGTTVVVASRWYASSKLCSACGEKNTALTLSDREWCCLSCGAMHDRDANAARNLLSLAGSSPVSACGADVRRGDAVRPVVKQEVPVADAHGI